MHESTFSKLNPWVWWLRTFSRDEIVRERRAFLPKPFDLAAILSKARGEAVVTTPPVLVRYKKELDAATEQALALNANNPNRKAAERMLGKPEIIAGGEAFALYGYGMAEKYVAVDEHVYETMYRLSGDNIQTLGSLSDSLASWKHDFWGGLSDKGVDKLGGHLGEVYAARHFGESGISVDWPSVSNQKGYDLIVSGHEVNVKTVADVDSVREHFRNNPDIPAVVPGDASNIPADAFHFYPGETSAQALQRFLSDDGGQKVIVDHSLSHDNVFEQAQDASDAALGGASIADLHFPWISAATSSWREWRLLSQSKTTIGTAVTHVGLDLVGRGGGAAVGGKVGATVGSLLGPIGAAIGGVVGAAAGAIMGGEKTDKIKYASLREAQSEFKSTEAEFCRNARTVEAQMRSDFEAQAQVEQRTLSAMVASSRSALDQKVLALKKWRSGDACLLAPDRAQKIIVAALSEHQKHAIFLQRSASCGRSWWQVLFPSARALALGDALRIIRQDRQMLKTLLQQVTNGESLEVAQLFSHLARIGVGEQFVLLAAETIECERKKREATIRDAIKQAYKMLADARAAAFARLKLHATKLKRNADEQMHSSVVAMSDASERLVVELRKHGMA